MINNPLVIYSCAQRGDTSWPEGTVPHVERLCFFGDGHWKRRLYGREGITGYLDPSVWLDEPAWFWSPELNTVDWFQKSCITEGSSGELTPGGPALQSVDYTYWGLDHIIQYQLQLMDTGIHVLKTTATGLSLVHQQEKNHKHSP